MGRKHLGKLLSIRGQGIYKNAGLNCQFLPLRGSHCGGPHSTALVISFVMTEESRKTNPDEEHHVRFDDSFSSKVHWRAGKRSVVSTRTSFNRVIEPGEGTSRQWSGLWQGHWTPCRTRASARRAESGPQSRICLDATDLDWGPQCGIYAKPVAANRSAHRGRATLRSNESPGRYLVPPCGLQALLEVFHSGGDNSY